MQTIISIVTTFLQVKTKDDLTNRFDCYKNFAHYEQALTTAQPNGSEVLWLSLICE